MVKCRIVCEPELSDYGWNDPVDMDDYEELCNAEKISCEDEINYFIKQYESPEESRRGLMIYYNEDSAVNEKVHSAFPSVEVKSGTLMGVLTCQTAGELTETELEELRSWWSGQCSDGWGEGFEQREIRTAEYGNIYVSFWNDSNEWSLLTEEELEQQEIPRAVFCGESGLVYSTSSQQNVHMGIAVTFVVNGEIYTHSSCHEALLTEFPYQIDLLRTGYFHRNYSVNVLCCLAVLSLFYRFGCIPQDGAF